MIDDNFLKTIVSYGLVIRGNLSDIERLKEEIAKIDGITIVYQRISGGRLFIEEGK